MILYSDYRGNGNEGKTSVRVMGKREGGRRGLSLAVWEKGGKGLERMGNDPCFASRLQHILSG